MSLVFFITGCSTPVSSEKKLVNFQSHIHGIAVDVEEPAWLYIATHKGLYLLAENKLTLLGNSRDDYMGFSIHPKDSQVFYSSGHPQTGGNLGVMKSEDGGNTWKKISTGGIG